MVLYRLGNYQFIMLMCSTDMLALPIDMTTVDGMLYKYTYIVLFRCSSQPLFPHLKAYFNITSCLLGNNSYVKNVKYDGRSKSKESFAIQRYLLIIGKK
jgi:hypothetical protein